MAQGPPTDAFDMAPANAQMESVEVQGTAATLYSDAEKGRTLLTWSADGVQFWIGGDITPEQAVAVANSLSE